jgi:hypothetical protein
VEVTAGSRVGSRRRGLSWTQMAELAESRGDVVVAAEFRRIAVERGEFVSGRESAVPPPMESRG